MGASHGGLRDFSCELTKNTPLPPELELRTSHGGLRDLSSKLTKNTPPELELLTEY